MTFPSENISQTTYKEDVNTNTETILSEMDCMASFATNLATLAKHSSQLK